MALKFSTLPPVGLTSPHKQYGARLASTATTMAPHRGHDSLAVVTARQPGRQRTLAGPARVSTPQVRQPSGCGPGLTTPRSHIVVTR